MILSTIFFNYFTFGKFLSQSVWNINYAWKAIKEYYSKRWPIEIFFKQTKNNLGLNSYQVRSTKSIDRILLLISLTYIFCTLQKDADDSFSKVLIICRNRVKKDNIQWIYDCAKRNIPIETIFKTMKID